jgi:hypothetical protein
MDRERRVLTPAALQAWAEEREITVLTADGFEDALVGVVGQFTHHIAVYDREKCLAILVERDGMDLEQAEEFFAYNVEGAWIGPGTPAFLVWPGKLDG